jgi:predicted dehydrogenase
MATVKKNPNNVGAAVVGMGRGRSHVKALSGAQGVELLAVCDIIPSVSEKVANEYGVDAYTDLDELLKREDIDLVHICTPSGMHTDMGIKVAKAGKNAMVEKPLDITLDKIDALLAEFESRNVQLGCIFQNRLAPVNQLIKQVVDAGRLGKMILANAHIKWFRTQEYYEKNGGWRGTWAGDGGGSLMNQSVHTIDLMQWIMGPVKSVVAETRIWSHDIETEDMGVALVKFANGALGTIAGSTATFPGFGTLLEVHGVNGGLCMSDNRLTGWKIAGDNMDSEEAEMLAKYGGKKKKKSEGGASDPNAIESDTTFVQIQDMVNAVRENREPEIPGREGRNAVEIILAIYESARTGKEVFLQGK